MFSPLIGKGSVHPKSRPVCAYGYLLILLRTLLRHHKLYLSTGDLMMSIEIATILDELRQDHRNMALLLVQLERQSERINSGDDADFELLHDVMQYMTQYPDAVHHPKEDRLYAELNAARPDLARGMSRVTSEHAAIAEQGQALRDKIQEVIAGNFVERNTVVADAERYIDFLRKHMRWEETDLFDRIDEMIADGHVLIDASTMVDADDPIFSDQVEQRYERLLSCVLRQPKAARA